MPCERSNASTAGIRIGLPSGLRLDAGDTTWRGTSRGTVTLVLHVTPKDAGDFEIPVTQTYSDGAVVRWTGPGSSNAPAPVVHVTGASTANRDRLVIVLLTAAVVVAVLALRRGRGQRG